MDRRVSVLARSGARGHDRPLQGDATPRAGERAPAAHRLPRAPHRTHDGLPRRAGPPRLDRRMKKLTILVLTHPDLVPPEEDGVLSKREAFEVKTEYDVVSALRESGHDVQVLGV